jgi:hypothetical protein
LDGKNKKQGASGGGGGREKLRKKDGQEREGREDEEWVGEAKRYTYVGRGGRGVTQEKEGRKKGKTGNRKEEERLKGQRIKMGMTRQGLGKEWDTSWRWDVKRKRWKKWDKR